jgi:hypothetical protein
MKKNSCLYIFGLLMCVPLVLLLVDWVSAGSSDTPTSTHITAQTAAPFGSTVIRTAHEQDYPSLAKVSLQQAIQTALAQTPGGLLKAVTKEHHGALVHHIEIVSADKSMTEFTIDAGTGAILTSAVDHADNDHEDADDQDDDE